MGKYFLSGLLVLMLGVGAFSQSVYKTPGGKKYHLGSCRMVKNVSEKITLEQAGKLGLDPCKICKPPATGLKPSSENKASGEGSSVQCRGITRAGSRCRHMTRTANGYCYQHQP